jgi:geranylgeranylglycerol-phosphate geranylgeranyltransferase
VSVPEARYLTATLLVASAVLILPVLAGHLLLGAILAAAIAALFAYEGRFKSEGLSGNALVAFLTAAVFLYGGAAGGDTLVLAPFAAMAFGATLSREIIKDMEDRAGDVGRRTLPRTHGLGVSTVAARGAVAAALLLSPAPFLTFLPVRSVAGLIYLALVLSADALFVVSVARLPTRLHEEQTLSKAAMTVAIVAFLAAAFR